MAAADAAGAAIRPYFRAGLAADLKVDQTPVTLADRAAEQAMRSVLAAACPGDGILGEEDGLDRAEARLRWVIDPIDGTRAFITGRPTFGTLIGLLENGVPVLGIIDQPVTGERWIGVRGEATQFTGGFGGQVGTRPCPRLAEAELSCTDPSMFAADPTPWQRLAAAARRVSLGGDCYAYGLLALGQIDVIAEATLKVWDWAALVPVIEGAGGRMTDWTGAPLRAEGDGRAVAVGDPALLAEALRLLGS
ncbi:inositol monophosphatase family protein [Acidisphaera rubrifaciens]|uniref:inositol monophosphatase family protein n=1 Tax=Acidisphaera rubrifaciens TaxID=50715 RepID=UPI000662583D|nr:inositol monophosphatase family protein [Acidisphaera rubrifaciens]